MYVIFEQRERAAEGRAFTDLAWERFYGALDGIVYSGPAQGCGLAAGDEPFADDGESSGEEEADDGLPLAFGAGAA